MINSQSRKRLTRTFHLPGMAALAATTCILLFCAPQIAHADENAPNMPTAPSHTIILEGGLELAHLYGEGTWGVFDIAYERYFGPHWGFGALVQVGAGGGEGTASSYAVWGGLGPELLVRIPLVADRFSLSLGAGVVAAMFSKSNSTSHFDEPSDSTGVTIGIFGGPRLTWQPIGPLTLQVGLRMTALHEIDFGVNPTLGIGVSF